MARAHIDGVQLEYEVVGAGDPVLLIHGAFVANSFRPLLMESGLSSRYRLIRYDRRGYGRSSRPQDKKPINAERQAADCAGLLQWLEIERAHVVGHSWGGSIALKLALDYPQVVRSLALLEPALFVGTSGHAYRQSLLSGADRYRVEGARPVMEEFLRARWPAYTRDALEKVVPGSFEQALHDAPTTFELDIGLTDWAFGQEDARRITAPVLVVLGGDSPALHPRFAETYQLLLKWLPNARGFVLTGATHFLQLESADASRILAAALADFFASLT